MTCPICGGSTMVKDCIKAPDQVLRIRRCLSCSHKFYTSETEAPTARTDFSLLYYERNHNNWIKAKKRKEAASIDKGKAQKLRQD